MRTTSLHKKYSLLQRTPLSLALTSLVSMALMPICAQASENNAETQNRPPSLETIKVIATPEDPRTSTGSAYVLEADELEKFKLTNINSVLRSVPGVYVREEDGLGMFPRIGVRASSSGRSNRISLLEDGIPAAMSPYANTSAYYFPNLGRISSIEVLKGAEVLLYGPQTTSGVVNLISTPIPQETSGAANIETGDFATRKIHAHYGTTQGQWGFLLETYQANSDGFHNIERSKQSAGYNIDEYIGKVRWNSAADARFTQQVDVKLQYDVENLDVSYLGQTDADFNQDANRRYGLSELERMDRGRRAASIHHRIGLTDSNWLNTTAYWTQTYRYYDRLNQINGINLGSIADTINNGGANADLLYGILRGSENTTHANGVRYGHNHQKFTVQGIQLESQNFFDTGALQHELTVGVRYNEETPENAVKGIANSVYHQVNGSLVYQNTSTAAPTEGEMNAVAIWIADRINVGNLTLLPVVRYEDMESKANIADNATPAQIAARSSNELSNTSAGLGATYALNEQWTLIGGVHEGFAPPGNGVGPGTKGEESTNYEAGVRYRSGDLGIDAVAFYSDYQNTLRQCLFANPCPNPDANEPPIVDGSTQQTGSKEVTGLELSAFTYLHKGASVSLPVKVSYTYTDGEYNGGSDLPTGVQKGDVIEYTPEHAASIQLGLQSAAGWNAYATLSYIGETYTTNTAGRAGVDSRFLKTEALTTLDLVASYPLNESAEVYVRVENALDQQKITHRGADGARGNAPRWTSVGLKLRF